MGRAQGKPGGHRICLVAISQAGCALLDAVRRDNTTRLAAGIARLGRIDVAVLKAAQSVLETLAEDTSV